MIMTLRLKSMLKVSVFMLSILCFGCIQKNEMDENVTESQEDDKFILPTIISDTIGATVINSNYTLSPTYKIIYVGKNRDSIPVNSDSALFRVEQLDTFRHGTNKNLIVHVDTSQILLKDTFSWFLKEHLRGMDKENSKVLCYPVYVINPTDSAVWFETQDGRLIAVQEALDPSGNWVPIETHIYS